jgi:hypothetical protein
MLPLKREVQTIDSRYDLPIAPNLLDRNFRAAATNRNYLNEVTYVETERYGKIICTQPIRELFSTSGPWTLTCMRWNSRLVTAH